MQIEPCDSLRWDVMEKPTAGELYEEHAARALRFAYLVCGDTDLAHDLVQDAFVKLLSRKRLLIRPAAFESYLRTTIVNLSRSRWRRVALERRHRSTRAPAKPGVDQLLRGTGRRSLGSKQSEKASSRQQQPEPIFDSGGVVSC